MILTAVHALPYSIPLTTPFTTPTGTIHKRNGWIIQCRSDAGFVGQGECAPLPGWSPDTWEGYASTIRELPNQLEGLSLAQDPVALAAALEGVVAGQPALQFALESALFDLAAQAGGVPLARWLNPNAPLSVPVNAVLPLGGFEETVAQAQRWVDEGFGTLKLKVRSIGDRTLLAALRDAIGREVRIRLDANGIWDAGMAIEAIEAFEPYGIEYIEQPTPGGDLQALADVRRQVAIPVAADESFTDLASARLLIEMGAIDVLVMKPMINDGLMACQAAARLARDAGVQVVVTTTLDSVVGRLGAAHLAAAAASPDLAQGLATGAWYSQELAPDPATIVGGRLTLPERAGLGLDPVAQP